MKKRGISLVENHFEKAVVGVLALAAVGVVVWEFALHRTEVKGGGATLAVSEVVPALERAATDLERRLAAADPSEEIPAVGTGASEQFGERLSAHVAPLGTLPAIGPSLGGLIAAGDVATDEVYYLPKFGAPIELRSVQFSDALTPEAVAAVPALASRFDDPAGPFDLTWVTPVASIDLRAALSQLEGEDLAAKPPQRKVSSSWYGESVFILDVVFERQERAADGSWGRTSIVTPAPWQTTLRDRLDKNEITADLRDELVEGLGDAAYRRQLIQPDLPDMRHGRGADPVAAADSIESTSAEEEVDVSGEVTPDLEQRRAQRRIDEATRTLARVEAKLKEAGGELTDDEWRKRKKERESEKGKRDNEGGAGGGGFGLGGGGMQGRRNSSDGGSAAREEQQKDDLRRNLTRQVASWKTKLSEAQRDLEALGGQRAATTASAPTETGPMDVVERLDVWTHDVEITPGHVYRYRATVRFFNPFFGRAALLTDGQASLAKLPYIASAISEWGAPIRVLPETPFFLADVVPGTSDEPRARFVLFGMYDGVLKTASKLVSIGDPISAVSGARSGAAAADAIPLESGWLVAGIERDPIHSDAEEIAYVVIIQDAASGEKFERRTVVSDRGSTDWHQLMAEVRGSESSTAESGSTGSGRGSGAGNDTSTGSGPPKLGS